MKAALLFSFISCTLLCSAQVKKGDSWAKVKADGAGTLAVLYNQTPGLIARQPDGSVTGVCVDILNDFQKFVKEKHGKTVSISYQEEIEFPVFLTRVQQTDNLLGVTNTSITEERKKIMKFTPLFMNNQVFLLTHHSVPTLKSLDEIATAFKGFKAQVITGSTHALEMEKIKKDHFPDLQIEYIPAGDVIIKNLSANKQLFSIIDFTEFIGVVKNRIPVKKHDVVIGAPEPLGFVMSRRSDWDPLWMEFLTLDYRKSVRYKEIIANNLGQSFMKLVQ